ncbi:AQP8 [Ramazzottius varieornatus]|uniref:AQP8 n=1 Tax=Ramazzottius varieornatus TaxID=947166 RepID=A0A1D1W7S0_RAMVA|nr:AQP8 [Ramazzottius varieornatus]
MLPLVASLGHFIFVLLLSQAARYLANTFIHNGLYRVAIEEVICTIQLCMNNFELGVITEVYGFSGYALGLFFTSLSYSFTFENGTADPSECLGNYCTKQIDLKEFLWRCAASLTGAAISYRLSKAFWAFQLTPAHVLAYQAPQLCTASLQVSLMIGALFEGFETLVNRLIQKSEGFNMLTGAVSDVAITFMGLFVSGGYFNPSLALAMEYGCEGLPFVDYLVVYLAAPMVATLLAVQIATPLLALLQAGPPAESSPTVGLLLAEAAARSPQPQPSVFKKDKQL